MYTILGLRRRFWCVERERRGIVEVRTKINWPIQRGHALSEIKRAKWILIDEDQEKII